MHEFIDEMQYCSVILTNYTNKMAFSLIEEVEAGLLDELENLIQQLFLVKRFGQDGVDAGFLESL